MPVSLDAAVEASRTGDLWLFRGRTPADRAIQTLTNSPVNHVGMALVLEDLPPMIWHAELGRSLTDQWTGGRHRGVQLHDLRDAVHVWGQRYGQRAWLRQLEPEVSREAEDAALRIIARLDGTPFPSTAQLAGRWLRGRLPTLVRRGGGAEAADAPEALVSDPTAEPWLASFPWRDGSADSSRLAAGSTGSTGATGARGSAGVARRGGSGASPVGVADGDDAQPGRWSRLRGLATRRGAARTASPTDGPTGNETHESEEGEEGRPALETAYCAEVVAITYQAMGLLASGRRPSWYDPGRFWSGDDLPLALGFALGAEIAVSMPD
ncbi:MULTISPECIES: hypothetical protein [unclassified Pseudofrankia]|uniref:hypothetical protein n=1 Tax=unclassified Pseudofrankia TaxID=2994372 RepID=UPI000B057862|nr:MULTISPECIES: hypothetical protein [unclassified Pseudofrankia]MDT3442374.1 hypothetical protein [Pseudofrankia sp. BMG5.37]